MNSTEMVRGLRLAAKKYEDVEVGTGETNISKMCTDVADKIEDLEKSLRELSAPWDVEEAPKKVGLKVDQYDDCIDTSTVCPYCADKSSSGYETVKEEIRFCKACGKKVKTMTFDEEEKILKGYEAERSKK